MHSPTKRALIVKLSAIGDCVMVIPAAFQLHLQGYEIDWVCGSAVCSLLECYDWIRVIKVDDRGLMFGDPLTRFKSLIALWKQTAFHRYTLLAVLYYDWRYKLLLLPVLSRKRLVLSQGSRRTSLLSGRNHADEYARILLQSHDDHTDQSLPPCRPDSLPPSPLPPRAAQRRIALVPSGASTLVRPSDKAFSLGPLSRRWPIENYGALARLLLSRGWEVVLLGGKDDVWARDHFKNIVVTNLIGQLTLGEVVSVCDACDVVVSHDTGPLHLAGLSKACLVGIFGPTSPFTFLPRRPYASGIWGGRRFACRPCYNGRDFAPCHHNGCMHQVRVHDALAELDRLLERRDRGLATPWRVVEPDVELDNDSFISISHA